LGCSQAETSPPAFGIPLSQNGLVAELAIWDRKV
jgi:hypothetical protein